MRDRIMRMGWRRSVLPGRSGAAQRGRVLESLCPAQAAKRTMLVLAAVLSGWIGTAHSTAPLDGPRSSEPRVVVAKCMTYPGLLASKGVGQNYARLEKDDPIHSRDLLVALPGFKVHTEMDNKAVELTLWGNMPGLSASPALESAVILHDSKAYDLDFTLLRGRVILTNTKEKGAAKIWLRAQAGVELVLPDPGDSVALELYGRWPTGVPFSLKHKPGVGPVNLWEVNCLKGQLEIKADRAQWSMSAPPGPAFFQGDSVNGPSRTGPEKRDKVPAWADPKAPPPPLAKKIEAVVAAYKDRLKGKSPEQAATELMAIAAKDPDKDRASVTRQLIVYAMVAEDAVGRAVDVLEHGKHADARNAAVVALRAWIGAREGRDEKLYHLLMAQEGFSKVEAEAVMQLLHSPFAADQPETYEMLIAYLKHRRQAVRELAAWHLYRLAPIGAKIPYDAADPAAERDKAAEEWKKLIPSGELPKAPRDETKEKGAEKEKSGVKARGEVKEKPEEAKEATLVVRVEADAILTVDGEPTRQRGTERRFLTPPLKPGKRYFYVVEAIWIPSGGAKGVRSEKAWVECGKTTEVDLRAVAAAKPDKIANR